MDTQTEIGKIASKKQNGGAGRGQGRKRVSGELAKSVAINIRLTPAQHQKYMERGQAKLLRAFLDAL